MKNKKGFTLIELIVALSVSAIFMVCVITLISPSTRIFNRVEDSSDSRLLTESLLEEIRHDANLATTLKAGEEDKNKNGVIRIDNYEISINDEGHLVRIITDETGKKNAPEELFDEKFYKNKTVSMTAENVEGEENCVDMTLRILSGERELYTLESRLKPLLGKRTAATDGTDPGGDDLGGVSIAVSTNWPPGEWPYYLAGGVFQYSRDGEPHAYYVVTQDNISTNEIDFSKGPDAYPQYFSKFTGRVYRQSDVVKGKINGTVTPGDLFYNREEDPYNGGLYVYYGKTSNNVKVPVMNDMFNIWANCDGENLTSRTPNPEAE